MKTEKKRDSKTPYFIPLRFFNYNPYFHWAVANNEQTDLADKLSKEYGIHEGNIFRLIMYTNMSWKWAVESDIPVKYSDRSGMIDFFKEPEPIDKVIFKGITKSFEISNPFLIQDLLRLTIEFREDIKEKKAKKKRPSAKIVKLIATEIYDELTQVEKIKNWKSLCITGFIFGLYNIGIKKDDYIMNQEQHEIDRKQKKIKGITTQSYRQYLRDKMKNII